MGQPETGERNGSENWSRSPLSRVHGSSASRILSEGHVRFLLVSGSRDDTSWGLVGAIWQRTDGKEGGYLVAPDSAWSGSEIAHNYKNAVSRGWTEEEIFTYWVDHMGSSGELMVDGEREADSLFHVARLIGAI
jgi:hypothetical protein